MALFIGGGCVQQPPMTPVAPLAGCRVAQGPVPVTWTTPGDRRDAERLAAWCASVGPAVVLTNSAVARGTSTFALVSWNVHEDAGDVPALLHALEEGRLTRGVAVRDYIVLLQEAVRVSPELPTVPAGVHVPDRIGSRPTNRADVVATSLALGLSVVYIPSMRNGASSNEDRGNAIVSTIAPSRVTAIELPFEHQRRVAVAATYDVATIPELRVVSAHLDTIGGVNRGGPYAARARQARALVAALAASDEPTIVGGDFNTWFGREEPAYAELVKRFDDVLPASGSTWAGPLGVRAPLDHVFARLPVSLRVTGARAPARFESDHYPLVLLIQGPAGH